MIWRSGSAVALYRGVSYVDPSVQRRKQLQNKKANSQGPSPTETGKRVAYELGPSKDVWVPQAEAVVAPREESSKSLPETRYEDEVDVLLNGLGPRYEDWPGCDPLPVDADLLPGIVPGYKPPFRLLPYGVRSAVGGKEATSLRRLARVLPPHFALGSLLSS